MGLQLATRCINKTTETYAYVFVQMKVLRRGKASSIQLQGRRAAYPS
jgi:hypothetical protein